MEIQDTLHLARWARLVSGAEVRHDRVQSDSYLGGTEDNVSYRLFGNLALDVLDPVTVNLGGYWERDQISDDHFSPRAGVNWRVFPGHHLRYVYSEALRTPDIYEERANINFQAQALSSPFGENAQTLLGWSPAYFFVTQQSPATFKPEKMRSWEVGYYGQFSAVELDVRYFQETLTNLLSTASVSYTHLTLPTTPYV